MNFDEDYRPPRDLTPQPPTPEPTAVSAWPWLMGLRLADLWERVLSGMIDYIGPFVLLVFLPLPHKFMFFQLYLIGASIYTATKGNSFGQSQMGLCTVVPKVDPHGNGAFYARLNPVLLGVRFYLRATSLFVFPFTFWYMRQNRYHMTLVDKWFNSVVYRDYEGTVLENAWSWEVDGIHLR